MVGRPFARHPTENAMRAASLLAASLVALLPAAALGQVEVPPPVPGPVVGQPAPGAPVAPVTGAPAPKVEKSGGYFGLSLGTGKGTLHSGNASMDVDDLFGGSGQTPTTFALQLRGGFGSGDLLLGTQLNLTRTWIESGGKSVGLQFFAIDAVATWWSQEMGIYTRIGIGPSQVTVFGGNSSSDPVQGVEFMVGMGFTMGGLGVGIDATRQNYKASEAGFDSVNYVLAMLSLDMY
jgi:hypothetical protein